jgi:group I intron endonuclease
MSTWIIYRHVNKVNNKSYIGLTKQEPTKRWQNGLGYNKNQPLFYKAIQKYGWENFEHELLEGNLKTLQEANQREIFWISYYHTWVEDPECQGYNLTRGGDGLAGHRLTEETKQKISRANKGKARSETFKQQLSLRMSGSNNHFYGRTHTEETKQKISEATLGRKHTEAAKHKIGAAAQNRIVSDETRQKLSEALKGKNKGNPGYWTGKTIPEEVKKKISETKKQSGKNTKQVMCIESGEIFKSMQEAAQFVGISQCTLSSCLAGRAKTAGKYHWRFVNIDD